MQKVNSIYGYRVRAQDGDVGVIHDLYLDTERWAVTYLILETREEGRYRQVLLSPVALQKTHDAERVVQINLTREQVWNSPMIDLNGPISDSELLTLHEHYGWPIPPGIRHENLTIGYPSNLTVGNAEEQMRMHSSRNVTGYLDVASESPDVPQLSIPQDGRVSYPEEAHEKAIWIRASHPPESGNEEFENSPTRA